MCRLLCLVTEDTPLLAWGLQTVAGCVWERASGDSLGCWGCSVQGSLRGACGYDLQAHWSAPFKRMPSMVYMWFLTKLDEKCIKTFKRLRDTCTQFSSGQLLSRVRRFATPWITALQASCPSQTPIVYSNSYPSSRWWHTLHQGLKLSTVKLQEIHVNYKTPESLKYIHGKNSQCESASHCRGHGFELWSREWDPACHRVTKPRSLNYWSRSGDSTTMRWASYEAQLWSYAP